MISPILLAERGLVPDPLLRRGIRRELADRLVQECSGDLHSNETRRRQFRRELSESAIAINTGAANEQHYEVPAALFELMLGPCLKYSSCWWDENCQSLADAEQAMLAMYAERARLENGQKILDLGCGWGSFTLWAAARYPQSQITAVSNSSGQREFIEAQAASRGLTNVKVITCNVGDLTLT